MLSSLLQDVRSAFRGFVKRPGFTLTVVLTLALGIGATTAIFTVVDATLLRPLPYPDPDRLVTMRSNQSFPDLIDVKANTQTLEQIGGVTLMPFDYMGSSEPIQVQTALVTPDFFNVLGAKTQRGRTIAPEENRFGGEPLAVVSHAFWRDSLGSNPDIIGKTIPLSGKSFTVVGVMSPGFVMPRESADIWVSLPVGYEIAAKERGVHFLRTYCRLKPNVTVQQAQEEMTRIDKILAETHPADNKNRQTALLSLHERIVGGVRPALLILFASVSFVLLVACANFANLLLSRFVASRNELGIRAALGAQKRRLIRQCLTESVALSLMGGLLGTLFASFGLDLLLSFKPANLPRLDSIAIDGRILLFSLVVSTATGIVFGLLPAWNATRVNLVDVVKEGGRNASLGRGGMRLQRLVVIGELALALVLLNGAGLLVKSMSRLSSVEPGFRTDNIITMRVDLPELRYKEIPKQTQFRVQTVEAVNSIPGTKCAMISEVPMSGDALDHNFVIDGRPPLAPGDEPDILARSVMGDYLGVMGIPLKEGRDLTPDDKAGAPLVGLLNEAAVRQFFPDGKALGSRIRWARQNQPNWITVVGIVADVKHFGLGNPDMPALYMPYAQSLQPWKRWMSLVVSSPNESAAAVAEIKRQVRRIDPQIPLTKIRTMNELMAGSLAERKFVLTLLGTFSATAFALALIGIFGVMTNLVGRRTREFGIRLALGARRRDIFRMIVSQSATWATVGAGFGLAASFAVSRYIESLLFQVSARDATTFAGLPFVLIAASVLACCLPALRAAFVSPVTTLRYE